jgi:SAM-dependent methyltransferase
MGTGGGEVLARISAGMPSRFVATEEWVRNAPVAHRRLAPLGIDVVRAQSLSLPFRDGWFDLVLNRHEELDPAEVARILAPDGAILTQQVGPHNWPELDQFFPRRHDFGDLFAEYRNGFETSGLAIVTARQHGERVAFGSLGDVAYMLLVAPWDIPGFDPEADIEALLALEDAFGTADGIVLTESRFVIEARKPS